MKLRIFFNLFITTVFLFFSTTVFALDKDTVSSKNFKEKAKDFFSLRNAENVRAHSKITTLNDYQRTNDDVKKWNLSWGGYIGVDVLWESRQSVSSREGNISLYPKDVQLDANGQDLNASPSFNIFAMNTRLTARIHAPRALNADISGMIEGWFVGSADANANCFSLRHAFINLKWAKTDLLIGQTWHPLFTEKCFAHTVTGSAGAPFQAFARSPQIRLCQHLKGVHNLMIYISSQRDFTSIGPRGATSAYLRNSAIPEAGLQYIVERKTTTDTAKTHYNYFGFGGDYKYLIPRTATDSNYYTRQGVHSWAAFVMYHHKTNLNKFLLMGLKIKVLYTSGVNDFLMMGGYAVRYYDQFALDNTVDYRYVNLNNVSTWLDVYVNYRSWEFGLFGAYLENIGSTKNIQQWNNDNSYFSRNAHICSMFRISPRICYNANKLQFALEPEYTLAVYGNTLNSLGRVERKPSVDYPKASLNYVSNLRLQLTTTLFF